MAALTRRTWATLKTEVGKRIGREGDTTGALAAGGPVEHWIDAAYRMICRTWHHPELDEEDPGTLGSGVDSLALPSNCLLPIAIRFENSLGNQRLGRATISRFSYLIGFSPKRLGLPTEFARFNDAIYFDRTTDASYGYDLYYYRKPVAVDFASGGSELDQSWDQLIVSAATELGLKGYWQPDLAQAQAETLQSWASRFAQVMIASGGVVDTDQAAEPHGGPQG